MKRVASESPRGGAPPLPARFPVGWVLAGLVPAVWDAPPIASLAWAAALLLGAALAGGRTARWVAVAWLAAAAVPGVPLAPVAAGGALASGPRAPFAAAALGAVLGLAAPLVPLPVHAVGALFLVAAAALAVVRRKA